ALAFSVTATMFAIAGILPLVREVPLAITMVVAMFITARGDLAPRAPGAVPVAGVTRTVAVITLAIGSTTRRTIPRWTSVAVWPPRRPPALTRGSLGAVIVSIVSIGIGSVAAALTRIVAGFSRIIAMPASAVMPADLPIPAAETRSTARTITFGGACACLIVVRRIDIGRLDGGGH
ncbi:MAG TPA: hypothetical protein VGG30_02510, partial [Pirellulales bacterium]